MPRRIYPDLIAFFADTQQETMSAIAKDVGCSLPFLSEIKWRKKQPQLSLALRIAQRCNVPLESLIRQPRRKAS